MPAAFLLFATLFLAEAPEISPQEQSADNEWLILLRDGDSDDRRNAERMLIRQLDRPPSLCMQQEIYRIYSSRDFPSEVRETAIAVLIETSGVSSEFLESLQRIAVNRKEPVKVRAYALMGLQVNLRANRDNLRIANIFLDILQDQTACMLLREAAAMALLEMTYSANELLEILKSADGPPLELPMLVDSAIPANHIFTALNKLIASREEVVDCRVQIMTITAPIAAGKIEQFESFAKLLMRLGADETESIHLRTSALNSLADLMIHSKFIASDVLETSVRLSRELTKLLANEKVQRRIREAAGLALRTCPTTDTALVAEFHGMLNSDESFLHEYAVWALRNIGPGARSSVPRLIEVWQDVRESNETRKAAKDAILEIDPEKASQLGIEKKVK